MIIKFTKTLFAFGALLLALSPAKSYAGYAGVLLGPSFDSNDYTSDTRFVYGANLGANISLVDVGLYVTNQSTASSGSAFSQSLLILAGELNVHLMEARFGPYVGAKLGAGIVSTSADFGSVEISDTTTKFVYGPAIGYQAKILDMLSVGPEVNMLFLADSAGFKAINVLASARLSF